MSHIEKNIFYIIFKTRSYMMNSKIIFVRNFIH